MRITVYLEDMFTSLVIHDVLPSIGQKLQLNRDHKIMYEVIEAGTIYNSGSESSLSESALHYYPYEGWIKVKLCKEKTPEPTLPKNSKHPEEVNMTKGEFIHLKRRQAKLTQSSLAEKAGVTTITISRIESGISKPQELTFMRICKALPNVDSEEALNKFLLEKDTN